MALRAPYDHDNVFARMLRGEIPAVKVHEDARTLAIMDIFPQSRGHVLVIPKGVEARNLLDLPPARLPDLMAAVQRVARAMERALAPDGLILTQFSGAPAGQTVFHLHFHLIPRYDDQALAGHQHGVRADLDELAALAARIAAAIEPEA